MAKKEFKEMVTPEAKNTRLNWGVENMEASEILNADDIRVTKSRKGDPYIVMSFANQPNLSALIHQLIHDQQASKENAEFITSKAGEPLEIDPDVKVGINDSKFFFVK